MKIRVTRFKNLSFQRNDGIQISKNIPANLNQSLISKIDFDDYIVRILSVPRGIAEKEFATFLDSSGKYIGCLVAGSSILSDENPNNDNPVFSAYSLIVAASLCASSGKGEYTLASENCQVAVILDDVFCSDFFYGVFQKSKLGALPAGFDYSYFASLFANGLILTYDRRRTLNLLPGPNSYSGSIKLQTNRVHPDYIFQIIVRLIPYTDNSFLRFFYLYQIIEYLMAEGFQKKYAEVKDQLDNQKIMSVTTLRDFLKKLDASTKEDARIRVVLQPACSITQLCAERVLDSLSIDRTDFSFADMVYKIRNVIFHDFPRIHLLGVEVGDFSDNLLRYIVDEKIL